MFLNVVLGNQYLFFMFHIYCKTAREKFSTHPKYILTLKNAERQKRDLSSPPTNIMYYVRQKYFIQIINATIKSHAD